MRADRHGAGDGVRIGGAREWTGRRTGRWGEGGDWMGLRAGGGRRNLGGGEGGAVSGQPDP